MKRRWTDFVLGELNNASYPLKPGERVWVNNLYQVYETPLDVENPDAGRWVHLSIKRRDRGAIHDWRDLQRIKNEIVGPEAEAVELYPAESRLLDAANQYHLWCVVGKKFPFGFHTRTVSEASVGGSVQRKWPDGERPTDCLDQETAQRLIEEQRLDYQKVNGEKATLS